LRKENEMQCTEDIQKYQDEQMYKYVEDDRVEKFIEEDPALFIRDFTPAEVTIL
jgi:hypothetical protein